MTNKSRKTRPEYLPLFRQAAIASGLSRQFGVERAARFLQAISLHENPAQDPRIIAENASSRDHGLMQINDINITPQLRKNIYDPYTNILTGANIFSQALTKADGDILKAFSIYNRGRSGERNPEGEFFNQNYVDKVRTIFSALEREAQGTQLPRAPTLDAPASIAPDRTMTSPRPMTRNSPASLLEGR